jgi:hypothetical protein
VGRRGRRDRARSTARGEIRRTGAGGSGRAMAGIICGIVGLVIGVAVFGANLAAR